MAIGKNDAIGKKAYEIAYALWRIAANSSEEVLANALRSKALTLVIFSADGKYASINMVTDGLEMIIKFAVDMNCMGVSNAAILVREIGNLKSAIAEIGSFAGIQDEGVDIADIFLKTEIHADQENFVDHAEIFEQETGNQGNGGIGIKAEFRQSAILERIRQTGNCRLSDIQAILPDLSERTIRYDLESLVVRGLIDRVGTGGRSVYYKIAQTRPEREELAEPTQQSESVTNPPDLRYI